MTFVLCDLFQLNFERSFDVWSNACRERQAQVLQWFTLRTDCGQRMTADMRAKLASQLMKRDIVLQPCNNFQKELHTRSGFVDYPIAETQNGLVAKVSHPMRISKFWRLAICLPANEYGQKTGCVFDANFPATRLGHAYYSLVAAHQHVTSTLSMGRNKNTDIEARKLVNRGI